MLLPYVTPSRCKPWYAASEYEFHAEFIMAVAADAVAAPAVAAAAPYDPAAPAASDDAQW